MIYLDANVIIRFIEGDAAIREKILQRLSGRGSGALYATSQLTRLECRVRPLRERDTKLLAHFDNFFASDELVLLSVDEKVIDIATEIRSAERFKTPDSIQLASAVVAGATVFLTADKQLARFTRVAVELI